MGLTQENRLLAITTSLGPNALAVRTLTVQEQLSRLFQIQVELRSEAGEFDFDKVVGHETTIRLNVGDKQKRFFHGFVSRLSQGSNVGAFTNYQATIVPWLWFLTRSSDCRIFQKKSVPDIIREVFNDHGFSDYRFKLGGYEPREYCVQYRETAFNFVSRLMEEEGIYYYFQHEDGKHTLIIADSISAHQPFDGYSEVTFHELERGAAQREVITDWRLEKEVQPVAYALTDFDFTKPKTSLQTAASTTRKYGKASFEMFDYPGEYLTYGEGERLAEVRLHELQTQYEVIHGQATARGLATGSTFKLKGHPQTNQNREHLVTGVFLHVNAGEFASDASADETFACSFTAIDKAQQFRPMRLTPKPIVQGPQTAIVVGPAGEEIFTDKHACVKVHFHWDRHDKSDENSSCWIRVSQYWAGKEWGSIHIPRLGQEVIVEFLEGDPDRPIITGRVYNGDQPPPYGLPTNKTQSGVKSRSSKGGASANFNEIRFEDKKGSEEVYIHAEKDQNNIVENDETTSVGHDRTETVGNDEKITIGNNRTEKVGVDEKISIGSNRTEDVGANESITVGANRTRNVGQNEDITVSLMRTHTVGINEAITIGAAQEVTIGAMQAITVGANQTTTVGVNQSTTVGANQTNEIGAAQSDTVGADRTTSVGKNDSLKVAKKLSIDAGEEILIKTGEASILMKKDGTIKIKGKDIAIEGSGEIDVKASKNITMKGKKILQN